MPSGCGAGGTKPLPPSPHHPPPSSILFILKLSSSRSVSLYPFAIDRRSTSVEATADEFPDIVFVGGRLARSRIPAVGISASPRGATRYRGWEDRRWVGLVEPRLGGVPGSRRCFNVSSLSSYSLRVVLVNQKHMYTSPLICGRATKWSVTCYPDFSKDSAGQSVS